MTITILNDKAISTERKRYYSVSVNGEIVYECISEHSLNQLEIAEIKADYVKKINETLGGYNE